MDLVDGRIIHPAPDAGYHVCVEMVKLFARVVVENKRK
jgi:hypothetical protein